MLASAPQQLEIYEPPIPTGSTSSRIALATKAFAVIVLLYAAIVATIALHHSTNIQPDLQKRMGQLELNVSQLTIEKERRDVILPREQLQGPKGDSGYEGPQGPPGLKGEPGVIGLSGPKGEMGSAGPQGREGPRGERGENGPKGEIGPIGLPGPKGGLGSVGPKGDRGLPGSDANVGQLASRYEALERLVKVMTKSKVQFTFFPQNYSVVAISPEHRNVLN